MYLKGKSGLIKLGQVKSVQVKTGVLKVSDRCLKGVCSVSQRCLKGIYGMSEWYVRCLDVSEGQVRTSQVRTGQDRCLEDVWQ